MQNRRETVKELDSERPRSGLAEAGAALVGMLCLAGCVVPTNPPNTTSSRSGGEVNANPAITAHDAPVSKATAQRLNLTDFRVTPDRLTDPAQSASFHFTAPVDGHYRLRIWTEEGFLVWESAEKAGRKLQPVEFTWAGQANDGARVPAEAYIPEVIARERNASWDPRESSGGERVVVTAADIEQYGETIAYDLPAACRIRIRAGSHYGALYSNIVDWEPRTTGPNVDRWEGRDPSGRVSFIGDPDLQIAISGYQLPKGTVIVQWPGGSFVSNEVRGRPLLVRHPSLPPVSGDWGKPLSHLRSPSIDLVGAEKMETTANSWLPVSTSPHLLVSREFLSEPFEISFYVDGLLAQEEPRGLLPYEGRVRIDNLAIGTHILTVNLGNFQGQFGTSSAQFVVKAPESKP